MVRVDKISITKLQNSSKDLAKLKQNIEQKTKVIKSKLLAKHLEVFFEEPISFYEVEEILNSKVKGFQWTEMKVGISEIGVLELTIS